METQLPDGIIIRHAALADVNSFRELRLEALKDNPTAFGQDHDENILRPQSYWEKTLTINNEEQALFFAERNGQLLGMTGIYRSLSKKNLHSAGIWGVYVKPDWRGRHISQALIQFCLDWAKQKSVVVVKLAVVTNNLSAIRCYKNCGFTTYGKESKALRLDGIYYDEYLMSCEIEY
jgi:RimJ/RimL family protein N-acetyltransferase